MSRFLEALHAGRIVSWVDALLLCLGLTGTVAALAPVLLRAVARPRRPLAPVREREDR
jgi:hypothetical protein